jgi:hypothetical protein
MGVEQELGFASQSVRYTSKFLFEEQFSSPFTGVHQQIFDLIDSDHPRIAIAAPRGIGKTTIARTVAAKGILFRDINFITYVSNSATVAEMQTENIKRELITNSMIRRLFGSIKMSDLPTELDEQFSKMAWVAFGNTLVLPRGSGQQIRGLNWSGYRPQLIVIDDLEDKDEIRNEDIRRKQKEWFFSDVLKSVNRYENDWRFIYIDTLKHEDSLLQTLLDSSDWKSVVLSICDEDFKSLIPEYMNDEEIAFEVERHREKGLMDVFYMEYMNQLVGEHSAFKPEYFRYYEEKDISDRKDIENIIIGDPAKTVNPGSAESAIVCVGIDNKETRYLVRDVVADKMLPDQFYEEIFQMAARWGVMAVGLEVTGLNEFITQPFKNEMMKRGVHFDFVELKPRGGEKKDERIVQLVPFYRQGEIWHNRVIAGPLEAQLIPFPRSKRVDIIDALAYMIQMLEMGMRYFGPPDVSDDPEEEFRELEGTNLESLGSWRHV